MPTEWEAALRDSFFIEAEPALRRFPTPEALAFGGSRAMGDAYRLGMEPTYWLEKAWALIA